METVLLWASVLLGVLVYLFTVLTRRGVAEPPPETPPLPPVLRNVALTLPLLGLLVSLPTFAPFSSGQGLGLGFLVGGVGSALASLPLFRGRLLSGNDLMAGSYGVAVAAVALTVLLLRNGLLDALMGVGIGWFAVAFTLYLGLSPQGRRENGTPLAAGTGFAVALSAGALIGTLRTPAGTLHSNLVWDAVLLGFAACGVLLLLASSFLPRKAILGLSLARLTTVVLGGGVGAYLLGDKVVADGRFWTVALGGLLLAPVIELVLRDALRRGRITPPVLPGGGMPLLAILLGVSGFLVAFQAMQAFGASVLTVALFLAAPAALTLPTADEPDADEAVNLSAGVVSLLLFVTGLLLYRTFIARWTGELRGVTLTDQYALFGLIVGSALPALLASVPLRRANVAGAGGVLTLAVCGLLTLLAPGAVIVLFGPKCALALLLGLALGAAQVFVADRTATGNGPAPTFFPFLFALAVSLALCQWGGLLIPAVADLTREAKVMWLSGLLAVLAVLLFVSDRVNRGNAASDRTGETGKEEARQ